MWYDEMKFLSIKFVLLVLKVLWSFNIVYIVSLIDRETLRVSYWKKSYHSKLCFIVIIEIWSNIPKINAYLLDQENLLTKRNLDLKSMIFHHQQNSNQAKTSSLYIRESDFMGYFYIVSLTYTIFMRVMFYSRVPIK